MPDMIQAPDGRLWYIRDGEDLEELVCRYAGDEAAHFVRRLQERDSYEETRALSEADVYEEELNDLTRAAGDWADELETIAAQAEKRSVTKSMLAAEIRKVAKSINFTI